MSELIVRQALNVRMKKRITYNQSENIQKVSYHDDAIRLQVKYYSTCFNSKGRHTGNILILGTIIRKDGID